ncbi:MAG TPA: hypothetical protein VH044_12895 [Polyangiaceae bacterium]|nr:hypothetical protein [Polyangiaceae bacterium]
MAHGLVGRLEELLAVLRSAAACAAISRANPAEYGAKAAQNDRSDQRHASREKNQQRSDRRELRQGARTPQESLLKSGLDLAHAFGERRHPPRCATDISPMIVLSWAVQAVNSQERVEEFETELAPHLARHSRLNERRVGACASLDDDHRESQ